MTLPCFLLAALGAITSVPVCGDTITSTVTASVGSSPNNVEDSQTDTFLPLSVFATVNKIGTVTNSNVSATFTSEDAFQVNVNNNWDTRGIGTGSASLGFGEHFDYEFVADGTALMVSTSNFVEEPFFSGASTLGAGTFLWRLFDLTTPNGFVVMSFAGNGTDSLVMTVGHSYSLKLFDQSSVAGGLLNLGLLHSATFDVSIEAQFNSGDYDGDGDVDGADFLKWQRGETDSPLSSAELAAWEDNYGTTAALSASVSAVPEPSAWGLLMGGVVLFSLGRLRNRL